MNEPSPRAPFAPDPNLGLGLILAHYRSVPVPRVEFLSDGRARRTVRGYVELTRPLSVLTPAQLGIVERAVAVATPEGFEVNGKGREVSGGEKRIDYEIVFDEAPWRRECSAKKTA